MWLPGDHLTHTFLLPVTGTSRWNTTLCAKIWISVYMMEKDSLHIGSSIQRLDPLLNNLMSGCSMQTVQSLKEILPTVDHHALQKIHPYLLVPMLGELGNRKLGYPALFFVSTPYLKSITLEMTVYVCVLLF